MGGVVIGSSVIIQHDSYVGRNSYICDNVELGSSCEVGYGTIVYSNSVVPSLSHVPFCSRLWEDVYVEPKYTDYMTVTKAITSTVGKVMLCLGTAYRRLRYMLG